MKSLAKTFSIPMNNKDLQRQQIQKALMTFMQEQQQFVHQKLIQKSENQNRIKKLQTQFQKWADKKELVIKSKLQKSQKNKNQILQKIVKKYKDKDKLHNQKLKTLFSKRRQQLRQAWRAANQFNQKILSSSKSLIKNSTEKYKAKNINQQEVLTKSVLVEDKVNQLINQENKMNSESITKSLHKSHDKGFLNTNINLQLKQHHTHSSFSMNNKKNHLSSQNHHHHQQKQYTVQQEYNPQIDMDQKFSRILSKHQQNLVQEENKKIQQLGKRLKKIQLYRIKKQTLIKQKYKSNDKQKSLDGSRYKDNQHNDNKKSNKIQKLKSQPTSCDKMKRTSNWSQSNRQRRQKMFNYHIQSGNRYLQQNKIRFLKEMLSRNSTYNAIEKKLYYERLGK